MLHNRITVIDCSHYVHMNYIQIKFGNKPAAQAAGQILPDATPPGGKIHLFSKIAVTFESISDLDALQDL